MTRDFFFFCFVEYVEGTVFNKITQTGLCLDRNRIVFLQELNCVLQELNCVLQELDCVLTRAGLCFYKDWIVFDRNWILFWGEKKSKQTAPSLPSSLV